jgi:predicted amidohydrolase YtcJ
MEQSGSGGVGVAVPGFVDSHAHLLENSALIEVIAAAAPVRAFHERVARAGTTPMDVLDLVPAMPRPELAARLRAGLERAAAAGLVEVTEMGMRDWSYLDALAVLQAEGPLQAEGSLPTRVRVYLASGLAAQASPAELAERRARYDSPWVRLDGVKFYADGWLGPRTCAMCRDFADTGADGLLFLDGPALAGRITPLIEAGWRIATHAIGDRAVAAVLDGYELAWAGDRAALAAAAPRIEHASLLSDELIARMAALGVTACIQPSFAVTDEPQVDPALGPGRRDLAYPWAALHQAGVPILAGSDYPIETLDPLAGLARLIRGRSDRDGFATPDTAPPRSRLTPAAALAAMTDAAAGETTLSGDPLSLAPDQMDRLGLLGTQPSPFVIS